MIPTILPPPPWTNRYPKHGYAADNAVYTITEYGAGHHKLVATVKLSSMQTGGVNERRRAEEWMARGLALLPDLLTFVRDAGGYDPDQMATAATEILEKMGIEP